MSFSGLYNNKSNTLNKVRNRPSIVEIGTTNFNYHMLCALKFLCMDWDTGKRNTRKNIYGNSELLLSTFLESFFKF